MTLRNELLKPAPSFAHEIGRKAAIRWVVVRYSVLAVLYWTVALIAAAWLLHLGLRWVVVSLAVVWTYFALPSFVVHCQMIIDLMSYALFGRTNFFPLLQELVDSGEIERRRAELPKGAQRFVDLTLPIFKFAGNTLPSVGVALWAIVVMARLPDSAYQRRASVREECRPFEPWDIRRAVDLARGIEFAAVEQYAGKQFARAG